LYEKDDQYFEVTQGDARHRSAVKELLGKHDFNE
jgi:hypothetical protein